jgi:hypothetical protein
VRFRAPLHFAIVDDPLPTNVKTIVNTVSITDDGTNGTQIQAGIDNTGE